MPIQKHYRIDVYDQDFSTFRASLTTGRPQDGSIHVRNTPSFSSRINGGLGELVLDLQTDFDSFSEGTTVDFLNLVRVYAVSVNDTTLTQSETELYRGYVSRYQPFIEEGDQGVRMTCLGLGSLLTKSFYSDGDFTVVHAGQDPTVIAKAIIDNFGTVFGSSLLSYNASSIPATVGTTTSITYTDSRWFDALKKAGELAGTDWWWRIGEDGLLYMQAKPSTPTYMFTLKREVVSLTLTKDSETIINDVYVRRSGGTETHYEDVTSQAEYGTGSPATGKFTTIISDTSLTDANAAGQRGNKELNDHKDAKTKATVVINSKHESFESIRPGQTATILNYDSTNLSLPSNMLIAGLTYNGDTITLELEEQTNDFGLALQSLIDG